MIFQRIHVSNNLLKNNIRIEIYDPKVSEEQINLDLSNLNSYYNKSLVNFVEEPFLNISDFEVVRTEKKNVKYPHQINPRIGAGFFGKITENT